jgi:hypothetical protein
MKKVLVLAGCVWSGVALYRWIKKVRGGIPLKLYPAARGRSRLVVAGDPARGKTYVDPELHPLFGTSIHQAMEMAAAAVNDRFDKNEEIVPSEIHDEVRRGQKFQSEFGDEMDETGEPNAW